MLKGLIPLTAVRPTPPTTGTPPAETDLARGRPVSASSQTQWYTPAYAVDGDANTYWESANNAFPQWLQVDLGAVATITRLVLRLPPPSVWQTRTQTLSVQAGTSPAPVTTVVASRGYTFDPASGNTVTITLPQTTARYVRLQFTANTGWPAAQVSELQVYGS
nr:discoidin domain-containing protein [Sphaerisporangium rubeum]